MIDEEHSADEFDAVRRRCLTALENATDSHLRLPLRKALLSAMGPRVLLSGTNRAEITPGLRRRTRLQVLATRKVLPIWDAVVGSNDPHRMLEIAEERLVGHIDWDAAYAAQLSFGGGLLNVRSLPEDKRYVVYVGNAAVDAVLTSLMDADFDEPDREDGDLDVYEGSLYACAAYSGELPWDAASRAEKRREFWTWWLEDAAPRAYVA